RGHTLSRGAAAETLWPEADPDHQAVNLRKAIHFARHALSPTPDAPSILFARDGVISVESEATLDLDLDRLRGAFAMLDHRSRHTASEVAAAMETALAIGSEELLPDDPYEEWLAGLRDNLSARWRDTALDAAREMVAAGAIDEAHRLLDQILVRDPADEDAHRMAIELFASFGQHHAARRQFFLCRRELASLGIEPSSETVATLGAAEAAAVARRWPQASVQGELVGRQAELIRLERTFDLIGGGRSATLVLRGHVGIGKSRLLEEVAQYGRSSGWQVLEARAVAAAPGLTFAPVGAALAGALRPEVVAAWPEPAASAAATLVPGLGLEPALPFKQPRALAAAVTEVVARLARDRPVALLIDDAHWLDDGSADLLSDVALRTVDLPLLLAVSLRTDEPRSAAVERLLDRLTATAGAETLDLGPLRARDIPTLVVRHMGGERVDGPLASFLAEHSGGNPLFCLELTRDARDRGRVDLDDGTWRERRPDGDVTVPRSIVRLVAARCRRLRPETRQLLALSAELGDVIDYQLVSRAASTGEETVVVALDEALEAALLVEARGGYRFAHPLFRTAVQHQTASPRRGRLMLSLAVALVPDLDPTNAAAVDAAVGSGVDPVAVADRALTACEHGVTDACPLGIAFGFAAAKRQIALFDAAPARALLDRALSAWARQPPARREAWNASEGWRMLGDVTWTPGTEAEAEAAYRQAIATARDALEKGSAYRALAWVPYRHGDYESMLAILEEAIALHPDDELLRGILMMDAGWLNFRHQRLEESLVQLQAAEQILSAAISDFLRMQVLDCLWGPLESLGRGDETVDRLHEALAISLRLRDASWESRIRTHLGFRMVIGGTPGRARPHLERSMSLASMIGEPYMESVSAWAAAEMAYSLGDDAEAERFRHRELELLSGLGGNARHEAMAHVHLVHILRRAGRADAVSDAEGRARELAAEASVTDPDFGRRVDAYLAAERWVPMSQ
ncbi:MAG TPA: AAA family ATPase, partial [Thermoanaerobaculia bacterium]|nr:AAA family ATPase [Thermoanaerobaculia bacterium]